MAEKKYERYIIKEPLEKEPISPMIHICAEEDCRERKGFKPG